MYYLPKSLFLTPVFTPFALLSNLFKVLYPELVKTFRQILHLGLIGHHLDAGHSHIITANPHKDYKRGFQFIAPAKAFKPVDLSEKLVIIFPC